MAEREFTLEEAEALLPQVRELLGRVEGVAGPQSAWVGIAGNGSASRAAEVSRTRALYAAVLGELQELGVVVRDLATGLIDFPAVREGRPIFLCWQRGEDRIGHWHDRTSGFSGRQPL